MPYKLKKPCKQTGCPNLTNGDYCSEHKSLNKRDSTSVKIYDSRWKKARERFLKINPLCNECLKEKNIVPATVVDHIVPHRGDKNLFWDESNWQPLCKRCHDKKTRTQDQYQEYKF